VIDVKVDNYNLKGKLLLRRYFLEKYHAGGGIHVLDCCEGSGVLWRELRKEIRVSSYWGVDLKSEPGRLKIDSARLFQPGMTQNVIDIDTYSSPWSHWRRLIPHVSRPTTVFMTRGYHSRENLNRFECECIGLKMQKLPQSFFPKLHMSSMAVSHCCSWAIRHGIMILEAVEAVNSGNARYFGLHIEPQKTAAAGVQSPPQPEHTQAEKEPEHV